MSLSIQDCAAQFEAYEQANLGAHTAGARDRAQAYRHAARFLRENAALQWTKEPPTQPGVYWVRFGCQPRYVVRLHRTDDGRLWASVVDTRLPDNVARDVATMVYHEWAGPLPEPAR